MKTKLIRCWIIVLYMVSIASCTVFDQYSTRERATGIGPDEAITIVGDERYIDCVSKGIQAEDSNIRIVPQAIIRDRFSKEAEEKPLDWLNDSKIHDHMTRMNVRYIIEISGKSALSTGKSELLGYGWYPFVIPMVYSLKKQKESTLYINVWEIKNLQTAGHLIVSAEGTQHFLLLGMAPIFVPAITEGPACKAIGERTAKFIKGNDIRDQFTPLPGQYKKSSQDSPNSVLTPIITVSKKKKIQTTIGVYYSPIFKKK